MNTLNVKVRRGLPLVAAALAVLSGQPAGAAGFGGALLPGSSVCTDWLRTDAGGIYLQGYAAGGGTYTYSLRMAAAPGAAEAEIFRAAVPGYFIRHVQPPVSGRFFYRACLDVAVRQAAGYRLTVSAGIGSVNPVYGVGPHVATLAPGSMACGEFAMGPTRLRGSANRAVQWSVRGTDLDYGFLGGLFAVDGASVDRSFDPGPEVSSTDACATNTTAAPTTVSFELLDP